MNDAVECQPEWIRDITEAGRIAYIARTNKRRGSDRHGRVENRKMLARLRDPDFVPRKWIQSLSYLGVYSLSATPCSRVMWERYADSHRGYCLEFTNLGRCIMEDRISAVGPLEVKYIKSRLRRSQSAQLEHLSKRSQETRDELFELLTHKVERWTDEEEWRLIAHGFSKRDRKVRLPIETLSRIILGLNASLETEETLRKWAATNSRIRFSRVREAASSAVLFVEDA